MGKEVKNRTTKEKQMKASDIKRWVLVHKTTGNKRRSLKTRDQARAVKRSTERIFDTLNGIYVR